MNCLERILVNFAKIPDFTNFMIITKFSDLIFSNFRNLTKISDFSNFGNCVQSWAYLEFLAKLCPFEIFFPLQNSYLEA